MSQIVFKSVNVHGFTFELTEKQEEAWNAYLNAGRNASEILDKSLKNAWGRMSHKKRDLLVKYDPANPQPFIDACTAAGIPVDPSAAPPGNSASVFVKNDPDLESQLNDARIAFLHLQSLNGGNDDELNPDALGLAGPGSAGHTPRVSVSTLNISELAARVSASYFSNGAAGGQADAPVASGAAGAAGGQADAPVASGASGAAGGQADASVPAVVSVPAGAAGGQADAPVAAGAAGGQADAPVASGVVAQADDDLVDKDEVIATLRQKLVENTAWGNELLERCKEKDKVNEELKSELGTLKCRYEECGKLLKQKSSRVTELEDRVNERDETIRTLNLSVTDIRLKHGQELAARDEIIEKLRSKIDEMNTSNRGTGKINDVLQEKEAQLKRLTSKAQEQDALVIQLEREKHNLTVANKTLEARITELTTVNETFKARISGHVTEKQALEARVTELTQEKDYLNSEALQGGEQNHLLRIQIGQLNTQISALTKERDDLQAALKAARETNNFGDISGQLTINFQRVEDTLTKQHGFVKQQLNNIVGMQSDVLAPGIRDQSILVQDFVKAVAGTAEELARGQAHMISQLDDIKLSTGTKSRFQQLETSSVCARTLAVDHKTETSTRSFDPSLFTGPISSRPHSVAPSVASSVASSVSSFGHSDRRSGSRVNKYRVPIGLSDQQYEEMIDRIDQKNQELCKHRW